MPWRWKSNRGVITRHPIDFYPERAAWAYGIFFGIVNREPFIELFNNDPQGRSFRVYNVLTGGLQNTWSYLTPQPGPVGTNIPPAGGALGFVSPLMPVAATPPGQILWGSVPAVVTPATNFRPLLTAINYFGGVFPGNHPLYILQPGWSLLSYGYQTAGGSGEASFLYMWD